ncbi:MAG: pyridoxamine 5'-phosphate oxidase [Gemmatimonadota bacterium]
MTLSSRLRALLTLGRGVLQGIPELAEEPDPILLFRRWFEEAKRAGILLPEAMSVATATPDGLPAARMMLLKEVGESGFLFYTNYESRKAHELEMNPRAALLFHWGVYQRQVRVEGDVARLSPEESAAYFRTRPRGSQLGAWASMQSRELESRAELKRRFAERRTEFRGREVPLPPFWGGYRLIPERIEFWQGRANRLHDRLLYTRGEEGGGWRRVRLFP